MDPLTFKSRSTFQSLQDSQVVIYPVIQLVKCCNIVIQQYCSYVLPCVCLDLLCLSSSRAFICHGTSSGSPVCCLVIVHMLCKWDTYLYWQHDINITSGPQVWDVKCGLKLSLCSGRTVGAVKSDIRAGKQAGDSDHRCAWPWQVREVSQVQGLPTTLRQIGHISVQTRVL